MDKPCRDGRQNGGKCILFKNCHYLNSLFNNKPVSPDDREFIKNSHCGNYHNKVYVCCSDKIPEKIETTTQVSTTEITNLGWLEDLKKLLPDPTYCGPDANDRIFGGSDTTIGEFSWTVLLKFGKRE